MVVCRELGHQQFALLVVLLIGHVRWKVLFHDSIDTFGLSIGLGMQHGGQAGLNLQHDTEIFPKTRNKLQSTIGNDSLWEAVQRPNIIEEHTGDVPRSHCFIASNEMPHLRQLINHNQDRSTTLQLL